MIEPEGVEGACKGEDHWIHRDGLAGIDESRAFREDKCASAWAGGESDRFSHIAEE